jgi:hypothetical protein
MIIKPGQRWCWTSSGGAYKFIAEITSTEGGKIGYKVLQNVIRAYYNVGYTANNSPGLQNQDENWTLLEGQDAPEDPKL